ncbi:MAG: ABC transporter permease [Spirochaetaceae bacterium]|jgi:ABC-type lipoprotein release transport system permease subunit|nr:ABC transporter permease [Spirochaetaceae bacterium]
MIWLLAGRNIVRNTKNSAIITILIAVITFLFFIGNTILGQSERSLHQAYVESLTGDIVIEKAAGITMSLFGANVPHLEDFFPVETLPVYSNLVEIVEAMPGIETYTSQISIVSAVEMHGQTSGVFVCGIDAKNYFSLFPEISLLEGSLLKEGETGAMITREQAAALEKSSGQKPHIGEAVRFYSAGKAGFKIREAPLVGIFAYKNANELMNRIVLSDAQTARVLAEIQVASSDVELSPDALNLLAASDIDDIFSEEFLLSQDAEGAPDGNALDMLVEKLSREETEKTESMSAADGAWNFILIRTKPYTNIKQTIHKLNTLIKPYGALAVDWRAAAGMSAILVLLLQALYNAGIVIVCIAGMIAIVNILLIAVYKRTREIGTLRALGARDSYIRLLLIIENCSLGLLGGIVGIALGLVLFALVNTSALRISNGLLASLLGGAVLQINFYWASAVLSMVFSVVLSFFALLLPAETAVRIEPVVAVREG